MNHPDSNGPLNPTGEFTLRDGEVYYRISGYDKMQPFLVSVASDTDLWAFVSSSGGLTAGRVDADGALFPYETVDKLHDGYFHTGPVTLIRRTADSVLWRPFDKRVEDAAGIERHLYKNIEGNRLVFEEINNDMELSMAYRWSGCDEFGLVRTTTILNTGGEPVSIELLDGLRNILPYGAPLALYQQTSSLVDAYKRVDCDPDTRLAIYSLTAGIVDRPEAVEVLRANVVWCCGLDNIRVALSGDAFDTFRAGGTIAGERVLTGRRGNYFAAASFDLAPGESREWHIVADVGLGHAEIVDLQRRITRGDAAPRAVSQGLDDATENLRRNVASADGIQCAARTETSAHHFANVLFNNMRGGVFADGHNIPVPDLRRFVGDCNRATASKQKDVLDAMPATLPVSELHTVASRTGDPDFERLCLEYLPLYFSRRHGDPSRPWNRFSIRLKNPDGSRALRYEGNWRDIFQNWEALAVSYPDFLPGFIAKFVNASTVDGFNPYRLTRDGVDWETIDPDDPWSYIGYWGDHQIVYLLRFLEAQARLSPQWLVGMLDREIFCYANVPYRIRPYPDLLRDPRATIEFDAGLDARIASTVATTGSDGKLVMDNGGSVYHVGLLEKLLVPVLSKLSNMVPGGGIWMNTQRPEWNDANNALAGYGLSMVTLCYLRRHLAFLNNVLGGCPDRAVPVSNEVAVWFERISGILQKSRPGKKAGAVDDVERKRLLDELGGAFSEYRSAVYANGFSGKRGVSVADVAAFCSCAVEHIDRSIRVNRREDGLYHAYNLLELSGDGGRAGVAHLYEMLEGQVAALSSGVVEPGEAADLVEAMFDSRLYRENQHSFLLYPERTLPPFLDKNIIPDESVASVPLLGRLLDAGDDSIVSRDASGLCRFHGDFRTERDVAAALDRLSQRGQWAGAVGKDRDAVLDVFSRAFGHDTFTGRSGAMYGYEGLGCIYWHMVAKLLVAVQETAVRAAGDTGEKPVFERLCALYYRIRSGLGFEKTVAEYGAFPTDPYSHTPPHAGARQPGMTGQVKEEILARFGELGVVVEDGCVTFRPVLLKESEFVQESCSCRFYDAGGGPQSIELTGGDLAFSLCGTPVVYHLSAGDVWVRVTAAGGASPQKTGYRLDRSTSRTLLGRTGEVSRVDVGIPRSVLCRV